MKDKLQLLWHINAFVPVDVFFVVFRTQNWDSFDFKHKMCLCTQTLQHFVKCHGVLKDFYYLSGIKEPIAQRLACSVNQKSRDRVVLLSGVLGKRYTNIGFDARRLLPRACVFLS